MNGANRPTRLTLQQRSSHNGSSQKLTSAGTMPGRPFKLGIPLLFATALMLIAFNTLRILQPEMDNVAHPSILDTNRKAEDYPLSKEFKNVYSPKWINTSDSRSIEDLTKLSVTPCDELVQAEFQALDAPTRARLGAVHAAEVTRAWNEFAKIEPREDRRYCVAQCGPNKCCPSGMVGPSAFETIAGQQPSREAAAKNGGDDVTLVTQGSVDRLNTFRRILAAWNGPIVALFVIYNQTDADWQEAADARGRLVEFGSTLDTRRNVQILLYSVTLAPKMDYYGQHFNSTRLSRLTLYPVNSLRNVVADRAGTNWVFGLDMDFVPSETLYNRLKRLHLPQMARVNRAALVVPHFEIPHCTGREMNPPRNFEEMDAMLLEGLVFPFHVRADRVISYLKGTRIVKARQDHLKKFADGGDYLEDLNATGCERPTKRSWPWGILPTDYSQWFRRSVDGEQGVFRLPIPDARVVSWGSAGTRSDHSAAWEPFVVVRRVESENEEQSPRFSESFIGRYRNKVEYISHLRTKRFKFYTILEEFTTHVPHNVSNAMLSDMQYLKGEMIVLQIRQTKQFLRDYQDLEAPAYSQFEGGYTCKDTQPS
eukprot:m.456214 g.456214  ORF g.456214 m.456214 type:complete len:595 (-) comp21016_c0_seq1:3017-4801(-)